MRTDITDLPVSETTSSVWPAAPVTVTDDCCTLMTGSDCSAAISGNAISEAMARAGIANDSVIAKAYLNILLVISNTVSAANIGIFYRTTKFFSKKMQ
jgi:hypothetical protein